MFMRLDKKATSISLLLACAAMATAAFAPFGPLENQASQKYRDRNVESPTDKRGA
jgi:hypothetical protein